jgi:hypothetical protein
MLAVLVAIRRSNTSQGQQHSNMGHPSSMTPNPRARAASSAPESMVESQNSSPNLIWLSYLTKSMLAIPSTAVILLYWTNSYTSST